MIKCGDGWSTHLAELYQAERAQVVVDIVDTTGKRLCLCSLPGCVRVAEQRQTTEGLMVVLERETPREPSPPAAPHAQREWADPDTYPAPPTRWTP